MDIVQSSAGDLGDITGLVTSSFARLIESRFVGAVLQWLCCAFRCNYVCVTVSW